MLTLEWHPSIILPCIPCQLWCLVAKHIAVDCTHLSQQRVPVLILPVDLEEALSIEDQMGPYKHFNIPGHLEYNPFEVIEVHNLCTISRQEVGGCTINRLEVGGCTISSRQEVGGCPREV